MRLVATLNVEKDQNRSISGITQEAHGATMSFVKEIATASNTLVSSVVLALHHFYAQAFSGQTRNTDSIRTTGAIVCCR